MKGAHLTLDDRKIIQRDLENGMNRAQIAKELGKSPSTISKEIKLHKKFKLASAYGRGVRYFCENSGKFRVLWLQNRMLPFQRKKLQA